VDVSYLATVSLSRLYHVDICHPFSIVSLAVCGHLFEEEEKKKREGRAGGGLSDTLSFILAFLYLLSLALALSIHNKLCLLSLHRFIINNGLSDERGNTFASTCGRLHCEFVRLLFLRFIGKPTAFLQTQEFRFRNMTVDSSTSVAPRSLHR
jgi:hypothetical protein